MAKIKLTSTPQVIFDGTKKNYATTRQGPFKILFSETEPDKTSFHLERKIYSENAKCWAWSSHEDITIDVSSWD